MQKVFLTISGGVLQSVTATRGVEVHVLDYDNVDAADNKAEEAESAFDVRRPDQVENTAAGVMRVITESVNEVIKKAEEPA